MPLTSTSKEMTEGRGQNEGMRGRSSLYMYGVCANRSWQAWVSSETANIVASRPQFRMGDLKGKSLVYRWRRLPFPRPPPPATAEHNGNMRDDDALF